MAQPNTLAVMQQIQAIITGLGIYTTIGLEAVKDWAGADPICEIAYVDDLVEKFADGGVNEDTQGFRITSAVNFTKQTPLAAITQLANIRDTVVYTFMSHAYLGNGAPAQVQDSRLRPAINKLSFIQVGGDDYLIYEFIVEVRSQWSTPIGVNGI